MIISGTYSQGTLPILDLDMENLTLTAVDPRNEAVKYRLFHQKQLVAEQTSNEFDISDYETKYSTVLSAACVYEDDIQSALASVVLPSDPSLRNYRIEPAGNYTFNLDTSVVNPDPTTLDGVYSSNNNGKKSTYAVAKITFKGYETFTIYIRSYGESNYDYIMASKIDAASYPTTYTAATVQAHTRGTPKSGTALSNYTKVTYTNDGGEHFIYVVYCKDGSGDTNPDKGYFLVSKG